MLPLLLCFFQARRKTPDLWWLANVPERNQLEKIDGLSRREYRRSIKTPPSGDPGPGCTLKVDCHCRDEDIVNDTSPDKGDVSVYLDCF